MTPLEGISGDGDSGGPALLTAEETLYVAGISSYQDENSYGLGTYGVKEYYVRVSQYAGWIEQVQSGGQTPSSADCSSCNQFPISFDALGVYFLVWLLLRPANRNR